MTAHKHLKQLIRARMEKTGERYATARRQILAQTIQSDPPAIGPATAHLPGNVPATTALRVLLAQAGVRDPHSRQPLSEAMLFGLAGGIGIGVFSFYYEREDLASFFLGGRHRWHDDQAYLQGALDALGATALVQESGGAKAAQQQLVAALERHGPCIAWVDMASLPHRAMPEEWSGGGYHVIVVYSASLEQGTALIGDLGDEPVSIALADLARARARIKKQRQRLLSLERPGQPQDLGWLVERGLRRCYEDLLQPTLTMAPGNARLEALRSWAARLHGSGDKESWQQRFRPGANLWRGLCAIHSFIEHYGTGGGLCRPIFAEFLVEAGDALGRPALAALAEQYAALGRGWSELADAALPDHVPALRQAKALYLRRAELHNAGAPAEQLRETWQQLAELERQAGERFPLSPGDCDELRAQLKQRVLALYQGEVAAHAAIGRLVGAG